jgi:hypothetical protein
MGAFPEEFAEKVRRRYPNNADRLHEALQLPDPGPAMALLDRYVHDSLARGVGAERIVLLLEQGKGDELLAEAKQILADEELYREAYGYAKAVPRSTRKPYSQPVW